MMTASWKALAAFAVLTMVAACGGGPAPSLDNVDPVCTPKKTLCQDGSVAVCNEDGKAATIVHSCSADQICAAGRCVAAVVCSPGESFCLNNRLKRCSSDGRGFEVDQECGSDQVCANGGCVDKGGKTCPPTLTYCEDNIAKSCNSDGSGFTSYDACSATKVCVNGECLVKICDPGSRSCEAGQARTCNSAGTGWAYNKTCGGDEVCQQGICLKQQCSPESIFCENNRYRKCSADGLSLVIDEDCGSKTCTLDGCEAGVCTPDTKYCDGKTIKQCNSSGTSGKEIGSCSIACKDGSCTDQLCEPGKGFCDGNTYKVCDQTGNAPTSEELCGSGQCTNSGCINVSPNSCLSVSSPSIDFGTLKLGETVKRTLLLSNCGTKPVSLSSVTLSPDDGVFLLDVPEASLLEPGENLSIDVTFKPTVEGNDQSTLAISSDAEQGGSLVVELSGESSVETPNCIQPTIKLLSPESNTVAPGALIKFEATPGPDNAGLYSWQVITPQGLPLPVASTENATFVYTVSATGKYTVQLTIQDKNGKPGCGPAQSEINVVPVGNSLQVELTWDTPGDKDPNDTCPQAYLSGDFCGSDMDLHLLHLNGNDYFDFIYDCYFRNVKPVWSTGHNPEMLRDDIDSSGPEVIALTSPESLAYRVAVHYWSAHGFGDATATVKIYIGGVLKKTSSRTLKQWQLWEVGTVNPVTGAITLTGTVTDNVIGDP